MDRMLEGCSLLGHMSVDGQGCTSKGPSSSCSRYPRQFGASTETLSAGIRATRFHTYCCTPPTRGGKSLVTTSVRGAEVASATAAILACDVPFRQIPAPRRRVVRRHLGLAQALGPRRRRLLLAERPGVGGHLVGPA